VTLFDSPAEVLQESDLSLARAYPRRCISIIKSTISDALAVLLFQPEMSLGVKEACRDPHVASPSFTLVDQRLLMTAIPVRHDGGAE
jgi:hypothetical protein